MTDAALEIVESEEDKALRVMIDTVGERVTNLVVSNQDTYEEAASMIQDVKERRAKVKGHHRPIIEGANATWKLALAAEKTLLTPLATAEGILKSKMTVYSKEQAKIAEEARVKAEREAQAAHQRKLAAAARYAENVVAACEDIDDKIKAINHELNDPEIEDETAQALQSQLRILEAQKQGKAAAAAAREREVAEAKRQAEYTPPPAVHAAPTVANTSTIKTEVGEVVDIKALIRAIVDGKVPLNPNADKCIFQISKSALNALIKAGVFPAGETTHGVRVITKTDTRVSKRR